MAVSSFLGYLKSDLKIQTRLLKVTQGFVGLSTQAIERAWGRNRCVLCSIQGSRHLFDGGMRGVQAICLFPGTLPIFQRLLPCTRLVKVVGQVSQVCFERRGVEALHRAGNGVMQSLAL